MNISQVNASNYNNLNFKSKILPTKYVGDLLDSAIKDPRGSRTIVNGFYRILNDGKDDIVKISYDKNKFWQILYPGSYSIKINNGKTFSNTHFVARGIKVQGAFALKEVFSNMKDVADLPDISNVEFVKNAENIKNRIFVIQQKIFDEYDYGDANPSKIKNLKKNLEFLKKKYDNIVKEELIKLKEYIFATNSK